jgi:hypothetical protein
MAALHGEFSDRAVIIGGGVLALVVMLLATLLL